MDEWTALTENNWTIWFAGLFALVEFVKWFLSISEWIISKFGIETKTMRSKRETATRLQKAEEAIKDLQFSSKENVEMFLSHEKNLNDKFDKLTQMFVDKEITDYRWEIINFANKIADNKRCNKDAYKHCIRTYEKYEKLLEENGLENGEVDISMEIVNDSYKEKLKNGF